MPETTRRPRFTKPEARRRAHRRIRYGFNAEAGADTAWVTCPEKDCADRLVEVPSRGHSHATLEGLLEYKLAEHIIEVHR